MGTSHRLKALPSLRVCDPVRGRGRLSRADVGHVQTSQSRAILARLGTALTGSTLPCSPFSLRIYNWGQYTPKNRITELKGKSTIYSCYGELAAYSPESTLLALPAIRIQQPLIEP